MNQKNIFNNSDEKNPNDFDAKINSTVVTSGEVSENFNKTESTGQSISVQAEDNNSRRINLKDILFWLGGLVIVGAIFCLLFFFCQFKPWWLAALILVDFYLLLLTNYLNKFKIKKTGSVFSLLLVLMPIIVLLFTGVWVWWLWLLVIGFYFLTLAFYLVGALLENYWSVSVPLSIFLILLLLVLNK